METSETVIRNKKQLYTEEDLTNALSLIGNGMSIRKAAAACGIPYPTVRRRLIKSTNTEIGRPATYNTKPTEQLTKEEQVLLQTAVMQQEICTYDNYLIQNRDKNNEVAADTDIDALMTENSANGWKGTAFSSDVSETETNAHDWKTTSKPTEHIVKKRKVQLNNVETENNQQSNGYLSSLATSSKDTAPFDWTANNGMHGRSVSYEGTANNQENTFQKDAVMETLEVCKTLLQKQTHKNNTQSREEIFCNYLCTELKKVTSDKIFQKLKLDILQLVNIALDADRVPTGSEIIQEIKVEPEIMIDSNS